MIVHFPEIRHHKPKRNEGITAGRQQCLSGAHDHGFWCTGFGGGGGGQRDSAFCAVTHMEGAPQAQQDKCPNMASDGARSIVRGTGR